jgi:ATP-dependent helicase/nuclease subunit A
VSERIWNPSQRQAIERRGHVFVSAGAGTGKTAVLVERVVQRVVAGTSLENLLVITFTDRAASELRRRVRERLRELGEETAAQTIDTAWISTIHGFCQRLLRSHALDAGIDPGFRVTTPTEVLILQGEGFTAALEEFVADDDPARLDLLAVYNRDRLRRMIVTLHSRLRSIGHDLVLRPHRLPDVEAAHRQALAAAAELVGKDEAAEVVEILSGEPTLEQLLALPRPRRSLATSELLNALDALRQAAMDVLAGADRELIEQLLQVYDRRYRAVKEARSLLDFDDLELIARDLLRSHPDLQQAYRDRFAEVMVDEFQDTNRLQVELVELVTGGDLFLVGDEFQSIYRFRRAEVDVYRERHRAAGEEAIRLGENYRSQQHIAAFVNETFRREFGGDYEDLVAKREDGPAGAAVELLLTDSEAFKQAGLHWREGEAAAIAQRVADLVAEGFCTEGEVVLLFEAGTDAGLYEDALRGHGLHTVRATGRGYYGQQEVNDLLTYLRLLRNRTDDAALLGVMASPLVGISNDGLGLIRLATRRRAAVNVFEQGLPEALSRDDERLARAFWMRYQRLAERAAGLGLERLCEEIVNEHDFDLALLARPDGDRRLANVRKLIRLAREFEQARGPDLEGFVRFCEEQSDLAAREGEAAIADEGGEAVLLMTVHGAKGLEFDVVVVADCGRRPPTTRPEVLVANDGSVGIRAVRPDNGDVLPALGWNELQAHEAAADQQEGRRLHYVAMTRARRHLIVSGGIEADPEKAPTPMARLCQTLDINLESEGRVAVGDAAVDVHVVRPEQTTGPAPGPDQLYLFETELQPLPDLTALPAPPSPPLDQPRRLSYSALALYDRCGYRFYAQRLLGLPERTRRVGGETMGGVEIGDAVHLRLERDDERWRLRYPHATDTDAEVVERLVQGWHASPIARRVGDLEGVRRELPFMFAVSGVVFRGRLDLYHRAADGAALVVDYKTNLLGERDPEQVVEDSYRHQVAIYALAVLLGGAASAEIVYAFLERPDAVVTRRFDAGHREMLLDDMRRSIERVSTGQFPARPGPQCSDCPALNVICAGPELVQA